MTRNLGLLLAFVVVLQFGYPITSYGGFWTAVYMLLYAGMIFYGVLTVHQRGESIRMPVVVGAVFASFGVWFAVDQDSTVATVGMLSTVAAFMFVLMVELMRFIFRRGPSGGGVQLVLAAVTVYLIIGGFFAALYTLMETFVPGSFEDPVVEDVGIGFQHFIYYSYVTLATLGYGEILPLTPWARSLASFETVAGTLFLTVAGTLFLTIVIARLVGAWASPATERQ